MWLTHCSMIVYVLLSHSKQGLEGGWRKHYNYRCQPVDYTRNPIAMRVSIICKYIQSSLNWNWNWRNLTNFWLDTHTHPEARRSKKKNTRMSMLLWLSATICQTEIINQKKIIEITFKFFLAVYVCVCAGVRVNFICH